MIRIALIVFPGSNCERETALAVKRAGMQAVEFLWNEPKEHLAQMDAYILIGGFSYEDRSRAGIIAALDPVMGEIRRQSDVGKPVLGICNGAQILLEAGLVPGLENTQELALVENKREAQGKIIGLGFYNAWVTMRLSDSSKPNAFTRELSTKDIIRLPVAHAEGRFVISKALLRTLVENGLQVFQYCDEKGQIIEDFPVNPNGSINNIAAIANKAGNIMAIMPHPERTSQGDAIFNSLRNFILDKKNTPESIKTKQTFTRPSLFQKHAASFEYLVSLIITDNHAMTVQNTLRKLGFPVLVNRLLHWEISTDSEEALLAIQKSGLLFSDRKEKVISLAEASKDYTLSYLVRPKEDIIGQKTLETFEKNASKHQLHTIKHGVLWQFSSTEGNIHELIDDILQTNILGNPYAHECYAYPLFQ